MFVSHLRSMGPNMLGCQSHLLTTTLPSRLWSLKIFPPLPGSRLRFFIAIQVQHSCTSSTDLQHAIEFYLLASHAFRYGSQNKNPDSVKTRTRDLRTTSDLPGDYYSTRTTSYIVTQRREIQDGSAGNSGLKG